MNATAYNESERTALENSYYWGDTFGLDTAEGEINVRRFGKWSLLTASYDNGEADAVLIHDGQIIYYWETDEGETPAPVQAVQELNDKSSAFYREYLRRMPYSAAKHEAEELYSLVTGGEC